MKAVLGVVAGGAALWALWLLFAVQSPTSHLLMTNPVATPLDDGTLAVFAELTNSGKPDYLIGAHSPNGKTSVYDPTETGRLPIPQGTVALALDGAHIRLASDTPVTDGTLIPVSLDFETAGTVHIKARLSDPKSAGGAEEVGLFGLGDICVVGEGEPAPRISLNVTAQDTGWRVTIDAEDFTFSDKLVGLYHVPGMGHGHLYVGGMKLGRLYAPTATIGALPKGTHEIRVTLNTNDHRAYVVDGAPVTAYAVINVD